MTDSDENAKFDFATRLYKRIMERKDSTSFTLVEADASRFSQYIGGYEQACRDIGSLVFDEMKASACPPR